MLSVYFFIQILSFACSFRFNRINKLQRLIPSSSTLVEKYDKLELSRQLHQLVNQTPLNSVEKNRHLEECFLYLESTSDPYIIADYIWLLGRLGLNFNHDSFNVSVVSVALERICIQTQSTLYRLNDVDIAKLFTGFARLKLNVNDKLALSNSLVFQLLSIFDLHVEYLGARSFSNVLWSVSKFGITKRDLSVVTRRQIFKKIFQISENNELTDQALSMILSSLHKFGYTWNQIPEIVQDSLSSSFCQLSSRMSSQAIGNILLTLGKMDYKYSDYTDNMKIAIELSVRKAAAISKNMDLMQIIYGMSLVQFKWNYLSPQTQMILSTAIFTRSQDWAKTGQRSLVEYSTMLTYLNQLGISWKTALPTLKSGILIGLASAADFNNTDYLKWNRDDYIKLEKLKYGIVKSSLISSQNITDANVTSMKFSNKDDSNIDILQAMESTQNAFVMAIPNVWVALAGMDISLKTAATNSQATNVISTGTSSAIATSSSSNSVSATIPKAILHRFYALTTIFASDYALRGFSMILVSLNKMNAKWYPSKSIVMSSHNHDKNNHNPSAHHRQKEDLQILPQTFANEFSSRFFLYLGKLAKENLRKNRKSALQQQQEVSLSKTENGDNIGNHNKRDAIIVSKLLNIMGRMGFRISNYNSFNDDHDRYYSKRHLNAFFLSNAIHYHNSNNSNIHDNYNDNFYTANEIESLESLNAVLYGLAAINMKWSDLSNVTKNRILHILSTESLNRYTLDSTHSAANRQTGDTGIHDSSNNNKSTTVLSEVKRTLGPTLLATNNRSNLIWSLFKNLGSLGAGSSVLFGQSISLPSLSSSFYSQKQFRGSPLFSLFLENALSIGPVSTTEIVEILKTLILLGITYDSLSTHFYDSSEYNQQTREIQQKQHLELSMAAQSNLLSSIRNALIDFAYRDTQNIDLKALSLLILYISKLQLPRSVFNDISSVITISSLYGLGISTHHEQLVSMRDLVLDIVSKHTSFVSSHMISNVLNGLQKLNFVWSDLSPSTSTVILSKISQLLLHPDEFNDPKGLVSCLSALSNMGYKMDIVACANSNIGDMLSKATHGNNNVNLQSQNKLLLSHQLRNSVIIKLESLASQMNALESRLVLRALADMNYSASISKFIKLILFRNVWIELHQQLQYISTARDHIDVTLVEERNQRAISSSFSVNALLKLMIDCGLVWSDIDNKYRKDLLQFIVITNPSHSKRNADHHNHVAVNDSFSSRKDRYAYVRNILMRLDQLNTTWADLSKHSKKTDIESFIIDEVEAYMTSPSQSRNSSGSYHNVDLKAGYDLLNIFNSMEATSDCHHIQRVANMLIQTSCDYVLFFPCFSSQLKSLVSLPTNAAIKSNSNGTNAYCRDIVDGHSDLMSDDKVIIDKVSFANLLKLIQNLASFKLKWKYMTKSSQRAVIQVISLSIIIALESVNESSNYLPYSHNNREEANSISFDIFTMDNKPLEFDTSSDRSKSTATVVGALIEGKDDGIRLFKTSLSLLLSFQQEWSEFPTRPRNLLSLAFTKVLQYNESSIPSSSSSSSIYITLDQQEQHGYDMVDRNQTKILIKNMKYILSATLHKLKPMPNLLTKDLRCFFNFEKVSS